MCKILIFGGTTEGRQLAEFCAEHRISAYVSSATDYGTGLIKKSAYITKLTGRMNTEEMESFILSKQLHLVIDATHPYASEVTANISQACRKSAVKYVRVIREPDNHQIKGRYFDSTADAAEYLRKTEGKILIATGSKELKSFCCIDNYSERCAVRVLPAEQVVMDCKRLGFTHIIAEQGPFSEESNVHHLKEFGAEFLVTKESGAVGGFYEKVSAAEKCGAELLIIRRPVEAESGLTVSGTEKLLLTEGFNE